MSNNMVMESTKNNMIEKFQVGCMYFPTLNQHIIFQEQVGKYVGAVFSIETLKTIKKIRIRITLM